MNHSRRLTDFARTRNFYSKVGFAQVACILDFYKDDGDKVVFRKRLTGSADRLTGPPANHCFDQPVELLIRRPGPQHEKAECRQPRAVKPRPRTGK